MITGHFAKQASRAAFVAAIGLSSFMLFAVELLMGRLLLPVFGGSPAVWTTALCFYAGMVFLGYAYATLLVTKIGVRTGAAIHSAVAIAALVAALLAPRDVSVLRVAWMPAALNVLFALAVLSAAPAFLLSATTPLLSSYYSVRHGSAWWLYAVSNGASMIGLLVYPLLIEPTLPLSLQRTVLFALLGILAVGLLAVLWTSERVVATRMGGVPVAKGAVERGPLPGARTQALWLLAAAVPAGLLSATTTHITIDIAPTPLLWIGPLAMYLGSFVVAFSNRGQRLITVADRLTPAAATLMWVAYVTPGSWHGGILVAALLSSFAVLSVAIHGRLAINRPTEEHLARFYLLVAAGGVVSTAFVALVAPVAFDAVYEYPILLTAGLILLALLPGRRLRRRGRTWQEAGRRLVPYLIACAALVVAMLLTRTTTDAHSVLASLVIGALIIAVGQTPRALAVSTGLTVALLVLAFAPRHMENVRTFFGVTQVQAADSGEAYSETHGTTLHGIQFRDERRKEPTSYYTRRGPLGQVIGDLRRRVPQKAAIGVVGLGVGTIAAYGRRKDSVTFFEVDPAIVDFATDERYFTYLSNAPTTPRVEVGDARLSLERENAASFDLLVLDAFSSDSIPSHLLTQEAMRAYLRVLRPNGVIAFHLTNRYFDIAPAVAATAESIGLEARVRTATPCDEDRSRLAAQSSTWLVAGRPGDLANYEKQDWHPVPAGPVLTDDFSDVIWMLRVAGTGHWMTARNTPR